MTDLVFMQQALDLAKQAASNGEIPVGAVIVNDQGDVIGKGFNQTIQQCNPSAHAEIVAIEEAALAIQNHRLMNSTLYVTLEPCPMCAGAIIQARIKRLVFACRDFKSGACGGVVNIINGPASNHAISIDEGVLTDECGKLLSDFFIDKRH